MKMGNIASLWRYDEARASSSFPENARLARLQLYAASGLRQITR